MIRSRLSQLNVLFGMLVFLLSACGTAVSETASDELSAPIAPSTLANIDSPTASPAPKGLTFIEFFAGT